MAIFLTSLITAFVAIVELSFIPYFRIFGAVPFLTLVIISLLSVKYRGYFHFFIAFFCGIYFDFISNSIPGLFTGVFVTTVIIGRAFFYRDTGYDSEKSFVWLTTGAAFAIYLAQSEYLFNNHFTGLSSYILKTATGIFLTLLSALLLYKLVDPYVDWLNKMNEEKYR